MGLVPFVRLGGLPETARAENQIVGFLKSQAILPSILDPLSGITIIHTWSG